MFGYKSHPLNMCSFICNYLRNTYIYHAVYFLLLDYIATDHFQTLLNMKYFLLLIGKPQSTSILFIDTIKQCLFFIYFWGAAIFSEVLLVVILQVLLQGNFFPLWISQVPLLHFNNSGTRIRNHILRHYALAAIAISSIAPKELKKSTIKFVWIRQTI